MRRFRPLDEFDNTVLHSIHEHPGESIRDYLKPNLLQLSEPAGRNRISDLELRGLVRLEKTKRAVKVWPTEALKIMFSGPLPAVHTDSAETPLQESQHA
jgi:hypothetical protein